MMLPWPRSMAKEVKAGVGMGPRLTGVMPASRMARSTACAISPRPCSSGAKTRRARAQIVGEVEGVALDNAALFDRQRLQYCSSAWALM